MSSSSRLRSLPLVVATLFVGAGAQCPIDDPQTGPRPEAGVVILDSGVVPPPDGGVDAGSDAGFDGGAPLVDAGAYDGGVPEVGVVCGEGTVCAPGVPCCVAITGFDPAITTAGFCAPTTDAGVACPTIPPISPFPIACDDTALDCAGGETCCFRAFVDLETFVIDVNSQCRPADTCTDEADAPVCVNGADCADGLTCCAVAIEGFVLPVDFGVCRDDCAIDLPDAGFLDDAGETDAN